MQLTVLPAVEMSFPLKVKLLPEVLLHVACPTYCHKVGVLQSEWETSGGWKRNCTPRQLPEKKAVRVDASTLLSPSELALFLFVTCRLGTMRSLRGRRQEEMPHIISRATPAKVSFLQASVGAKRAQHTAA